MYRHRIRPPGGNRLSLTGHAGVGGSIGTLFTKALTGISALAARGRMAISQSGFGYITTTPPPTSWNVTPAPTFAQGSGGTYNVASTGPVNLGYDAGGLYDVDASGTPLPTGMSLSDVGILAVGSATESFSNNVKFGYVEPSAWSILTLHTPLTAVLPYEATVYPCEGAVPSGRFFVSPIDSNLRSSTLASWPDGSAQIMVVAGNVQVDSGVPKQITLRLNKPTDVAGTSLTVAAITSKFTTGISVDFGTGVGTLNTWTSPDRIWWQNSQVICARYRLAIPGKGSMEAVIDVHAFAGGRAFVEVVIENCRLNAAQSTPAAPAAQTYTNATVSVNGVQIQGGAGVSSAWPGGSTHTQFRSWYCAGWIGGDPQIEVTHDIASMQAHPILFKPSAASSYNFDTYVPAGTRFSGTFQTYGTDAYAPWVFGRNRWDGMGDVGDSRTIGYLPQWEGAYIQTGNKNVRKAVIASALAQLGFPINYRDTNTNDVPTLGTMLGKSTALGFPYTGGSAFANYNFYGWDYAHSPAVGLLPFLCRPSPCFIELAQKAAMLAALGSNDGDQKFDYWYETRGRAWCTRNLGFSIFLTPDTHPWKSSARTSFISNLTYFRTWETDPEQKLNVMWGFQPGGTQYRDQDTDPGFHDSLWMHHFYTNVIVKLAQSKVLGTLPEQASLDAHADWAATQPIRFVNESSGGEWRFSGYKIRIGNTSGASTSENLTSIGSENTWGLQRLQGKSGGSPPVSGTFMVCGSEPTTFSSGWNGPVIGDNETGLMELNYTSIFWHGFVAAVERGVPGADAAWTLVSGNITNLTTFLANGGKDCRFNTYPRNKP